MNISNYKKDMKLVSSISAFAFGALMFGSCSPKLAPIGHFQNEPVVIDGNINDWILPLRFSNPDYTMHYSVTNDDKNIYICVYSRNQAYQKRMLKAGMSIYFDSKAEKNKGCALIFPVKKTSESAENTNGDPMHYSDYHTTINQLVLQSDYYNTTGFVNMENGQYDLKATQTDIRVAIKLDADSSLIYEASVPIHYVLGKDISSGTASENFSVGIALNPSASSPRNNGYQTHSSHGGSSMGGMHGMGGSRHNGPNNYTPQKTEENWYTFRFANKKSD
jgi:hypothetical protein